LGGNGSANDNSPESAPRPVEEASTEDNWPVLMTETKQLTDRCRQLLERMHEADREEAIDLNAQIESAIHAHDPAALRQTAHELSELLFFVEGRA
ncbi:MAG: hypothetical protein J2P13_11785, partial [Acidobacteria bacterium]|nr:hypothetical protein [Acidobacteriota bacterium]